ncbi:unnamed protein product [Anisakis simplex]|uniref:ULP_PROTEASE domain-containing protein n=1 Tax=Anisakis simplex TaxID=6269 RepID=A0A0M3IZY7_ANISI|nr:unnamed protein product [Anisakis simplex]
MEDESYTAVEAPVPVRRTRGFKAKEAAMYRRKWLPHDEDVQSGSDRPIKQQRDRKKIGDNYSKHLTSKTGIKSRSDSSDSTSSSDKSTESNDSGQQSGINLAKSASENPLRRFYCQKPKPNPPLEHVLGLRSVKSTSDKRRELGSSVAFKWPLRSKNAKNTKRAMKTARGKNRQQSRSCEEGVRQYLTDLLIVDSGSERRSYRIKEGVGNNRGAVKQIRSASSTSPGLTTPSVDRQRANQNYGGDKKKRLKVLPMRKTKSYPERQHQRTAMKATRKSQLSAENQDPQNEALKKHHHRIRVDSDEMHHRPRKLYPQTILKSRQGNQADFGRNDQRCQSEPSESQTADDSPISPNQREKDLRKSTSSPDRQREEPARPSLWNALTGLVGSLAGYAGGPQQLLQKIGGNTDRRKTKSGNLQRVSIRNRHRSSNMHQRHGHNAARRHSRNNRKHHISTTKRTNDDAALRIKLSSRSTSRKMHKTKPVNPATNSQKTFNRHTGHHHQHRSKYRSATD